MSPDRPSTTRAGAQGHLKVESASFGVIFNKTIEQLQTEIDYYVTAAHVDRTGVPDDAGYPPVTLTIPATTSRPATRSRSSRRTIDNYVGEYEVESVNGNEVTIKMDQATRGRSRLRQHHPAHDQGSAGPPGRRPPVGNHRPGQHRRVASPARRVGPEQLAARATTSGARCSGTWSSAGGSHAEHHRDPRHGHAAGRGHDFDTDLRS